MNIFVGLSSILDIFYYFCWILKKIAKYIESYIDGIRNLSFANNPLFRIWIK